MPEEKRKILIDKLKNMFMIKTNDDKVNKSSKKKIENIVVFIIILIITVIFINAIWKSDDLKKNKDNLSNDKILAKATQNVASDSNNVENTNLESKLESILQNIEGVGRVKVLLTYSESSKMQAMYNEDNTKSDTEEIDSRTEEIEK